MHKSDKPYTVLSRLVTVLNTSSINTISIYLTWYTDDIRFIAEPFNVDDEPYTLVGREILSLRGLFDFGYGTQGRFI